MKSITAFIFAFIFAFFAIITVHAQTTETIWITAGTNAYKTGETVLVSVNALSVTPIQGFTFQIRYDPACLQPVNAVSPIPGMNGLSLPQTAGLVDASFASTVPQTANGVLAEVSFVTLGGCQTGLNLESAALAIRNESGFAAPLPGVNLGQSTVALNIDSAIGDSQSTQPLSGTPLPLGPTDGSSSSSQIPILGIALLMMLIIGGLGFGIYKVVQKTTSSIQIDSSPAESAIVSFKLGSHAGKRFSLKKLPCLIGRDTNNDICLSDPQVIGQHAQIYAANNGFYLRDMGGGETFINGQSVRKSSAPLQPGDVVRLGRRVMFVFGT